MTVMRFVVAADCSQNVVIALGLLFAVFFVGFVIAVVYIIYIRRKLRGMSSNNIYWLISQWWTRRQNVKETSSSSRRSGRSRILSRN